MTKRCSMCERVLPVEEFYVRRNRPDGRQARCKACANMARTSTAPERRRKYGPSPITKRTERRCGKCGETKPLSEFSKPTKVRCKSCHVQDTKDWQRRNPEKLKVIQERQRKTESYRLYHREYAHIRRARKKAAFVERVDPVAVYERDGGVCGICREPVDRQRFSIDHVVAISRGGTHEMANVQLAHPECNSRKWAHSMDDLLGMGVGA